MPVTDGVVRIDGPVWLFRRDEDAFRLTDEDCRHIVTADRCNAVICAHTHTHTHTPVDL